MVKVLFLDVDGVLNTIHSMSLLSLSKKRMSRLRRILRETDCKLVLSSTWRLDQDACNKLTRAGLKFIGRTRAFKGTEEGVNPFYLRGHEIQNWLDNHPEVERYCILDDNDEFMDHQQPYYVKTTMEEALTEELADKVIEILNGEDDDSDS